MAFTRHETPDEDDFFGALVREPQPVTVLEVGKMYDVEDKPAQKYFYIKYLLCNTTQEQSVAYNVKFIDGEIVAPEGSKLFPLLSFASGIEDGEIHCNKEDIDEFFTDKTFIMKARKQKGKTKWFKLIPIEEV